MNATGPWTQFSTLNNPTFTFPVTRYLSRLTYRERIMMATAMAQYFIQLIYWHQLLAFSGAPLVGPAPLPVSFTDGSTNTPNLMELGI